MKEKYILLNEICEADYEKTYLCMHPDKKAKVNRLMREPDRKRSLAGEFLAKMLLAEMLGISFEEIELFRDETGRPYVLKEKVWVSISHSEDMAAAAVSQNPIGVDVEKIHSVSGKLANRICFPDELEYIFGALPTKEILKAEISGEALHRFFEVWTLKEACFKCFGSPTGIFSDINVLKGNFESHSGIVSDYTITTVISR